MKAIDEVGCDSAQRFLWRGGNTGVVEGRFQTVERMQL